jgi:hypothetical protein
MTKPNTMVPRNHRIKLAPALRTAMATRGTVRTPVPGAVPGGAVPGAVEEAPPGDTPRREGDGERTRAPIPTPPSTGDCANSPPVTRLCHIKDTHKTHTQGTHKTRTRHAQSTHKARTRHAQSTHRKNDPLPAPQSPPPSSPSHTRTHSFNPTPIHNYMYRAEDADITEHARCEIRAHPPVPPPVSAHGLEFRFVQQAPCARGTASWMTAGRTAHPCACIDTHIHHQEILTHAHPFTCTNTDASPSTRKHTCIHAQAVYQTKMKVFGKLGKMWQDKNWSGRGKRKTWRT